MRHLSSILTLSSLVLVAASASAAPNLISDGGFEGFNTPANGYSQYFGGGSIGGWSVTGTDVLLIGSGYTEVQAPSGTVPFTPQEGSVSLDITGAGNTSPNDGVTQTISTVANQRYFVSFYVGRTDANPDDPRYSTPSTVDLSINGAGRVSYTNLSTPSSAVNWQLFTTSFVASGSSTSIAFFNGTPTVSDGGNNFAGLDNVSVTAVPGPASLVSFGVTGLAMLRRRRKA